MPSGSPKSRSPLAQRKARLWAVGLGALAAGFLLLIVARSLQMDGIVLKNGKGVEVHLIRRGAIITRLLLPDSKTSAPVDVVLGFDEEQPYKVGSGLTAPPAQRQPVWCRSVCRLRKRGTPPMVTPRLRPVIRAGWDVSLHGSAGRAGGQPHRQRLLCAGRRDLPAGRQ